jgi:hypothetical protein
MEPLDVLTEVKKLNFPDGHFMVVGSGILSITGIRPAYDLDIVISKELFEKCKKDGWEIKPWTRPGPILHEWLKKDNIELMVEMNIDEKVYRLNDLTDEAMIVDGIHFLSLNQLIEFKEAYGRQKDFDDIMLIKKYLESHIQ